MTDAGRGQADEAGCARPPPPGWPLPPLTPQQATELARRTRAEHADGLDSLSGVGERVGGDDPVAVQHFLAAAGTAEQRQLPAVYPLGVS
jgi:hypothetical protein